MSTRVVGVIEGVVGRRQLWRLGRLIYRQARRDGNNSPEINGEYALHRKFSQWAGRQNRPVKVVDVGANIGYWSSHLLDACQGSGVTELKLWVFEPSDEIREQLVRRMQSVPANYEVSIHSQAVAEASGQAAFDATPGITGIKHLLTDETLASGETPSVDVDVTTLVEVFEKESIDVVDFVKSDVEGFDLSVLRGAVPLLEEGRIGLFQFEYNHCWISTRTFLRDVFELAESLPYRVCKVVPEGIDSYDCWHQELETYFETNYLLVREDLLKAFAVRDGSFAADNTYASVAKTSG